MYIFICFLLICSGGGILYVFPYESHPGKAVVAIILIRTGLFLFLYRGKDAARVGRDADLLSRWWPW